MGILDRNKIKARLQVKGADKIIRGLFEIEPRMARKVVRQSLRKGLNPIQRLAKSDAPVKTGLVKKSIKIRAVKRKKDRIAMKVTIGKDNFVGKAFYGAFQEFGYKHGSRKLPPEQRPEVPGKHFMQEAFTHGAPIAEAITLGALKQGFDSVVKELGPKS